jgi:hypothetical protein
MACSAEDETRGVALEPGRPARGGSSAGSNDGGTGGIVGAGGSGVGGTGGKTGQAGTGGIGSAGKAGSAAGGSSTVAGAGGAGAASGGAGKDAGGAAGEASLPSAYLSIVKPTEGQVFVQSGSPAMVDIPYEVLAGPGIASVEYVIETDFSLGTTKEAPTFPLTYPYQYPGNRVTEARGFDAAGKQVATATVDFVIKGPGSGTGGSGTGGSGSGGATGDGTCYAELDALGITYTKTQARGVVDAARLSGPVNGVLFAKTDTNTPSADPMACEFVKTLHAFAGLLKTKGFVKVGTLGAYCYRCCCSWSQTNYCRGVDDPEPSCGSSGYSNHSFGRALDIRYLYKADGTRYDINDPGDFVKWPNEDETCAAALAAQTGVSKELYGLACAAAAQKIFGSILTPNHNAAHRNHFHADIGKSGTPSSSSVHAPSWGTVRIDGPEQDGDDE